MLVYMKWECCVMQMLYGCDLWASCILHDLKFVNVNAGGGCKRQPYGRGILQSQSHM